MTDTLVIPITGCQWSDSSHIFYILIFTVPYPRKRHLQFTFSMSGFHQLLIQIFLMMLWSLSHDHGWMISKVSGSVATLRSGGLLQGEFEALGTRDTDHCQGMMVAVSI